MTVLRIHGDFLEVGTGIKDNSIDLLLTDPPYNISEAGAKPVWLDENGRDRNSIHSQRFDETFDETWDSIGAEEFKQGLVDWSQAWFPKLRKGATFVVFISDRYISYLWTAMESAGFEPKRVITWKKPAAVPFNRGHNPVSGCEYILWGIKPGGKRTFNANAALGSRVERMSIADKIASIVYKQVREASVLDVTAIFALAKKEAERVIADRKTTGDDVECVIPNTITYSGGLGKDKIHPTQKPEEILKYFIELCSNPGDWVLDSFAGSGSTGRAAVSLGRNAVLVERDAKMFAKMDARFNDLID